jgi:hypothetical protein
MTQPRADVLERVCRYVQDHPGCDAREVALAVPAIRGVTDAALRRLTLAGFLDRRDGRYRAFKLYRASAA